MIHLASRSPRRRVLLEQIGVDYEVVDAPIDESRRDGEPPERFVERMACEKVRAGLAALGDARVAPVLAADTTVVLDDQVLGKPRDAEHAAEMLRALSGRMHLVISAVALAGVAPRGPTATDRDGGVGAGIGSPCPGDTRGPTTTGRDAGPPDIGRAGRESPRCMTSISRVWFRELTHEECSAYCATGEPLDKAGAYAIQGRAATFVRRLDGSFSGVMGLPLFETASLLRDAGIRV